MKINNAKSYSFQTDTIGAEIVEFKGEKKYFITGYISTKDKDLVNDVVTDAALSDMVRQIESKNIKLDVDHEVWRQENPNIIPIGRIVEAKQDDRGIFVKAELNKNHSKFKEVWNSIQDKFIDAFSIAYKAIKFVNRTIDGVKTRILDKVDLLNVALTGNPVNPSCQMTSVFTKSLNEFEEVHTMAEEEKAPVEETPKQETAVEKKAEETPEEESTETTEQKSEEAPAENAEVKSLQASLEKKDTEIKSIQAELKSKETEITELKSKIESQDKEMKSLHEKMDNPIMKAAQKSMEQAAEAGKKPMSPLDAI